MGTEAVTVQSGDAMTATEIAEYEQEKEMYRKMGIDIESVRANQRWKETEPIRKALALQIALKTQTVIEVEQGVGYDWQC